jgi:hypothetical protein
MTPATKIPIPMARRWRTVNENRPLIATPGEASAFITTSR